MAHRTEWLTVSPELAEKWLETKAPNRHLNERTVIEYGLVMEKGDWEETHQGLGFDERGRLVDGQHRLKALTLQRPGTKLRFLVTHGLTNAEVLAIDRNRVRDAADSLTIYRGTRVEKHTVAIANRVIHISPYYATKAGKTPGHGGGWRVSTQDLDQFLRTHSIAMMRASELKHRAHAHGLSSALIGSLLFRAYYHLPTARFDALLDVLATGHCDDRQRDSAGILLRDHLMTGTEGWRGTNLLDHYRMERAIKAFWKGEKLAKIYPATEELFLLPEEKGAVMTMPATIRRMENARAERARVGGSTKRENAKATAAATA